MMDMAPNRPEVVAEVRERFERYEQALIDKNVDVLDATFWESPHTIRYALNENGYGFDAIHASPPHVPTRSIRLTPSCTSRTRRSRSRSERWSSGTLRPSSRHRPSQGAAPESCM